MQLHAFVEYETAELAEKAVSKLNLGSTSAGTNPDHLFVASFNPLQSYFAGCGAK